MNIESGSWDKIEMDMQVDPLPGGNESNLKLKILTNLIPID